MCQRQAHAIFFVEIYYQIIHLAILYNLTPSDTMMKMEFHKLQS